jgi:hypothetical protein
VNDEEFGQKEDDKEQIMYRELMEQEKQNKAKIS